MAPGMPKRRGLTACACACALWLAPTRALADTYKIELTEVPYRDPGAVFVGFYVEGLGIQAVAAEGGRRLDNAAQLGIGLRVHSARRSVLQLEAVADYRRVSIADLGLVGLRNLHFAGVSLGARLFPLRPTFALGDVATRLTGSLAGGATLGSEGAVNLEVDLTAGLCFSLGDDPSGLSVEVVYRPLPMDVGYSPDDGGADQTVSLSGSLILRAGVYFGP